MGKMLLVVLVGAIVVGAGFAAYNAVHHDLLQPFPLSWNHLPEEMQLFELEQRRRELAAKLGSAQRITGLSGLHTPFEATGDPVAELTAELALIDAQITALRGRIRAFRERRGDAGRADSPPRWTRGP